MPESGKLSKQADDYDHGYQISKAVSMITQRSECSSHVILLYLTKGHADLAVL
jgi:hypothetical protein